ncbi:MAG: crosslink repair DNA glycosylase YcaQ family protein [Thermoanaerobaculia bacterium]
METISTREARRLALARAGLLRPERTGLPRRARGRGLRARAAALAVVRRFGYLQLDSIPVAGARTHAIVLLSRLEGFDPDLAETLLAPGEPLFEYWGHEASWMPLELYPLFAFRRREFRSHPWWGDVLGEHPEVARTVVGRIEAEGPQRSLDLTLGLPRASRRIVKRVTASLWLEGTLAVRERRSFQRIFDLTERVIPQRLRESRVEPEEALRRLLLRALAGHGWAARGTLAATWRLKNRASDVDRALGELAEAGEVVPCRLRSEGGAQATAGWIRRRDLDLANRLARARPRPDRGVLLSPFDPLLWDRARVRRLFGFDQVLEIYKPETERTWGYYCLPVLAGERLVARIDLKAERPAGRLDVLSLHWEGEPGAAEREAAAGALADYAAAVGLEPGGDSLSS